jgi:hypothetical protein
MDSDPAAVIATTTSHLLLTAWPFTDTMLHGRGIFARCGRAINNCYSHATQPSHTGSHQHREGKGQGGRREYLSNAAGAARSNVSFIVDFDSEAWASRRELSHGVSHEDLTQGRGVGQAGTRVPLRLYGLRSTVYGCCVAVAVYE